MVRISWKVLYIPVNKGQSVSISQQFKEAIQEAQTCHAWGARHGAACGGWKEELRRSSGSHRAGELIIMNKGAALTDLGVSTEPSAQHGSPSRSFPTPQQVGSTIPTLQRKELRLRQGTLVPDRPGSVPRSVGFPKGLRWPTVLGHTFKGVGAQGVTRGSENWWEGSLGRGNSPRQRQGAPGSAFTFPAQVLGSVIAFKSCGSF